MKAALLVTLGLLLSSLCPPESFEEPIEMDMQTTMQILVAYDTCQQKDYLPEDSKFPRLEFCSTKIFIQKEDLLKLKADLEVCLSRLELDRAQTMCFLECVGFQCLACERYEV
jgi:hypothetical protein